jgi:hypothetical protein
VWNSLTTWGIMNFPRRTLLHELCQVSHTKNHLASIRSCDTLKKLHSMLSVFITLCLMMTKETGKACSELNGYSGTYTNQSNIRLWKYNIDNECYKLASFHSLYFTADTKLYKRVTLPGPAMFLQKILECDLIPFNSMWGLPGSICRYLKCHVI